MKKKAAKQLTLELFNSRENIDFAELNALVGEYHQKLLDHSLDDVLLSGKHITDHIKAVKRISSGNAGVRIGPYIGLTVFEALNRIATDLVVLHGLQQLIKEGLAPLDSRMSLCLGNENHLDGDFEINGEIGEAFNTARSFFPMKLRMTLQKWNPKNRDARQGKKLSYIFYNGELSKELLIPESLHDGELRLIGVAGWDTFRLQD